MRNNEEVIDAKHSKDNVEFSHAGLGKDYEWTGIELNVGEIHRSL